MSATEKALCDACGSVQVRPHCDGINGRGSNPACTWWFCGRCKSYGDARTGRYVDVRSKR